MLNIPPTEEALNGVKMELLDSAFPLLKGVVTTTDVVEACSGSQASALENHAAANCKVSARMNVQISDVKNVIIWGNHSSIQYPDVTHATLKTPAGEKPVRGLVGDDTWLNREFIITANNMVPQLSKREALYSALCAASA
ncbi:Malate dehydrogenase, cytoplasmic [Vitis vinifera]|uniref:Malate dehydrogenase, cytoplasmic n=1 Tax=Vitis vinifera TaxID=29760 RepID=A0A438FS74_VITVI|nr:Malate dehydrogenase, cytoplasmic [Vitis vinifera]